MARALDERRARQLADLDRALVEAAKGIKILSRISWDARHVTDFLAGWRAGAARLPRASHAVPDLSAAATALRGIAGRCDVADPLQGFVRRSAESYLVAIDLLRNVGKAPFNECSKVFYGHPRDRIAGHDVTAIAAAEHFLAKTDRLLARFPPAEEDLCVMPEAVAAALTDIVRSTFTEHPVEVTIDPALASKASAGRSRIRIRGSTCFSEMDIPQLAEHEALVHTLTLINGQCQPVLTSLSLGAPRTTRTQEGIAIFAELITNSIDLVRLRRLAARVKAVDMALEGADFLQVFEFFLAQGQSEHESALSTMRIFRGGDPAGGIAFTKDACYLPGFVEVHDFLSRAMESSSHDHPLYLLAGRLTTRDVAALVPAFESGVIELPRYAPRWIRQRHTLMAFLVYSAFTSQLGI